MANNKKRKPNTERHKERKTSTTEMTRTLYFIITTLNYMEREAESDGSENATAQATARDRAGRWHLRIVHWPFACRRVLI